jgi:hypothetical protein
MDKYDPASDTHVTYSLTSTGSPYCNGRGIAWDGTNLWYSVVGSTGTCFYKGDGLIHKVGPTGGADLLTVPDPYGLCGRGIGAMKFDAALPLGHLWIESYIPDVSSNVEVSELAIPTGTVLASCELPFRGGGVGSDTFSLFSGNEFATDGGEILTTLYFYDLPSTIGGNCVQHGAPATINGATGLNFASNGDCIYTPGNGITYNGGTKCDVVKASTTNAFPFEEDITCTVTTTIPSICGLPPPINSAPEFGVSAVVMGVVGLVGVALFRVARRQQIPTFGL